MVSRKLGFPLVFLLALGLPAWAKKAFPEPWYRGGGSNLINLGRTRSLPGPSVVDCDTRNLTATISQGLRATAHGAHPATTPTSTPTTTAIASVRVPFCFMIYNGLTGALFQLFIRTMYGNELAL